MADDKIIVYGAPWCPDCKRAKQFLGEQRIPYSWVDIDEDGILCSVVVNLSVDAKTSLYEAQVSAGSTNEVHPVSHPISESALKAALLSAYVAEATRSE